MYILLSIVTAWHQLVSYQLPTAVAARYASAGQASIIKGQVFRAAVPADLGVISHLH